MVVCFICNPSPREVKAGGFQVQGQLPITQQDPVINQWNIGTFRAENCLRVLASLCSLVGNPELIPGIKTKNIPEAIQLRGRVYGSHSLFPRFKLNLLGIWDIRGLGHSAVTGEGSDRMKWSPSDRDNTHFCPPTPPPWDPKPTIMPSSCTWQGPRSMELVCPEILHFLISCAKLKTL